MRPYLHTTRTMVEYLRTARTAPLNRDASRISSLQAQMLRLTLQIPGDTVIACVCRKIMQWIYVRQRCLLTEKATMMRGCWMCNCRHINFEVSCTAMGMVA